MSFIHAWRAARGVLAVSAATVALLACSSTADKSKPAELPPNPALLGVRQAWSVKLAPVDFPIDLKVVGTTVLVAGSDGSLAAVDARNGAVQWRVSLGAAVAAGVGSDGRYIAVLTRANELVVLEGSRELWRKRLSAPGFTAPLVAGERVFLATADRTIAAFDAQAGHKLWSQTRPGDALVLRQAGVLLAVGDTLVAGSGGRLLGLDPGNGTPRWETVVAQSRGTNDVERLVDLVGRAARDRDLVCVRAFQTAVGCVDSVRGNVLWGKSAYGSVGLALDDKFLFGTEADGKLVAWRRSDGERAWVSEHLRQRKLTAPAVVGRSVVMGDDVGLLHWFSRADGSVLTRMGTDGSALIAPPVLVDGTLVAVTRAGGVFGFLPE